MVKVPVYPVGGLTTIVPFPVVIIVPAGTPDVLYV